MLASQTDGEVQCAEEYRTLAGQPCVPGLFIDLDCDDLAENGINNVQLVGESDPYDLDRGGNGTGCEAPLPRKATDIGNSVADIAPWALPALVLLAVALVSGALLYRARAEHSASTDQQRRSNRFTTYLTLGLAIPLVLIGALVMALIGLD